MSGITRCDNCNRIVHLDELTYYLVSKAPINIVRPWSGLTCYLCHSFGDAPKYLHDSFWVLTPKEEVER